MCWGVAFEQWFSQPKKIESQTQVVHFLKNPKKEG